VRRAIERAAALDALEHAIALCDDAGLARVQLRSAVRMVQAQAPGELLGDELVARRWSESEGCFVWRVASSFLRDGPTA
jgi:hypothetical protein